MPPKSTRSAASKLPRQTNVLDLLKKPKILDTIDLTSEETTYECEQEETVISHSITCPICDLGLDSMVLEARVRHVETCMTVIAIKEINHQQIPSPPKPSSTCDVKGESQTSASKSNPKKPKLERERYNNASVAIVTESKAIKVPSKILKEKANKRCIPDLKILTFPKLDSQSYQVCVDAFSYCVHDSIDKYFLTHFHSDHYGGISRNWCFQRVFEAEETDFSDATKFRKLIYCTPITARLLSLKFGIDHKFIQVLEMDTRYLVKAYVDDTNTSTNTNTSISIDTSTNIDTSTDIDPDDCRISTQHMPGLYVTPITANHCPGAAIFLMESIPIANASSDLPVSPYTILHCGDFRVCREILEHPLLRPFRIDQRQLQLQEQKHNATLDKVYLDTTYLDPDYSFPKQENVCAAVGDMFEELLLNQESYTHWFGSLMQSRITDFLVRNREGRKRKKRFLILVGTYLIGKERIAIALLKRLGCPIYVLCIHGRKEKLEIVKSFDDAYLNEHITTEDIGPFDDPDSQCMVHLVPMKIVSTMEEMANYFNHNKYFEHFEMCVGLRPSGWTFKNMYVKSDPIIDLDQIITSMLEDPKYTYGDNILPQIAPVGEGSRGGTTNKRKRTDPHYRIYTVPYSEHSSFRELCYFCSFLRIAQVIPTVNTENQANRHKMDMAIGNWEIIRKLKDNSETLALGTSTTTTIEQRIQNLQMDTF